MSLFRRTTRAVRAFSFRYTRRDENFVLVRSNRAITVAARNRRLALVTNILSRDSDGAVPMHPLTASVSQNRLDRLQVQEHATAVNQRLKHLVHVPPEFA